MLAVAGGLALAIIAVIVIVALTSGGGQTTPGERPYLAFKGCLLTDWHGLAGSRSAAAWAGLQQASAATRMQAQYLTVPQTASSAAPFLASLIVQRCGLVVAQGPREAAAVMADARRFPQVRFVVVGGRASGANVTVVSGPASALRSQVAALAQSALAGG
jgi:basic membrane lipoprotein Med (substrate-binding protein (PBP1-ABC) superfamily)